MPSEGPNRLTLASLIVVMAACCALLYFKIVGSSPIEVKADVSSTSGVVKVEPGEYRSNGVLRQSLPQPEDAKVISTWKLAVEVVSADGAPLPDAAVTVLDLEISSPFLQKTGEDGVALFEECPEIFAVSAKRGQGISELDYFERALDSNGRQRVLVSLPPQRTVRGQVVDSRGFPLGGASIVAIPASLGLSAEVLVACVEEGTAPLAATTSDEAGQFELSVPAGVAMKLFAGTVGFAAEKAVIVKGNDVEAVITLDPVFGALVHFELDNCPDDWDWSLFSDSIYPDLPVPLIVPNRVSLVLGGMAHALTGFRAWPKFSVITLAGDYNNSVGNIGLRGEFPGFEKFSVEIPLSRLSSETDANIVRLKNLVSGRGNLRVSFVGIPKGDIVAPPGDYARGTVYLVSENGKQVFSPVWDLSGTSVIRGIPAGLYQVFFVFDGGTVAATPSELEIREREDASAVIEFRGVGTVELDIRLPGGKPSLGKIIANVRGPINEPSHEEVDFVLSGRPYLLDLLKQGDYSIKLYSEFGTMAEFRAHLVPEFRRTMPIYLEE
jgi:hypothetical protein